MLLSVIQRDSDVPVKCAAQKILYFSILIFGFLVHASYTALLTSTMVFSPEPSPIRNFQDVIDKNLKLVILANTSLHQKFLLAPVGSPWNRAKRFLLDSNPK